MDDEFVEQFLIESRELVEQATGDLLALEKSPGDHDRIDSAFRGFHTLKGGAAIVEFAAMEKAVHAGEDVLAAARSGDIAITSAVVDECLACLDQVVQWLDAITDNGRIPPSGAAAAANAVVARFAKHVPAKREDADAALTTASGVAPPRPAAAGSPAAGNDDWLSALCARLPAAAHAVSAVRFVPSPDCFFRGEDPIARMAGLPGLLGVDLMPTGAWPALSALDPYRCNLVVFAVTDKPPAELAVALGDVIGDCDVRAVKPALFSTQDNQTAARLLLEAQELLLDEHTTDGVLGRIGSAGAVAANVLRHLGRASDADRIASITKESIVAAAPALLRDAVRTLLVDRSSLLAPAAGASQPRPHPQPQPQAASELRSLRVDAARIDALVSLTGEFTIAANAIGHTTKLAEQAGVAMASVLKAQQATLQRLVGELQTAVVRLRVLPLSTVFHRFPRLVRDMSIDLGKAVTLVTEGEETEADKTIVEMLFEPLVHVLRNAMDHGIERERERRAAGKPSTATLTLTGSRQGDRVLVEVADDGAGIDVDRVRAVALQRSIAPAEALAAMSESEVIDLIFTPGFSTAGAVTGVSGRGVGMDAVRAAVHRVGGEVSVASVRGQGTKVRFLLPFAVMLTRVMTVEAGAQLFGIPFDAILETLRVPVESIAAIGASHAMVLRNRTIPVLALGEALGFDHAPYHSDEAVVVIVEVAGTRAAVRVDRIGERVDVMLKPLDGILAGTPGILGSAVLGDGGVLLVLDLEALVR